MKNYPPQFKADAVALYQSRPEATIRQVAADLGINPETLRNWVRAAGASRPRGRRAEVPTEPPTPLFGDVADVLRVHRGGGRYGYPSRKAAPSSTLLRHHSSRSRLHLHCFVRQAAEQYRRDFRLPSDSGLPH
ncbi:MULTISPECIES: transposase [unclassified Streptomyces]|uniref:Transposase n=1 Tax=Streptomyces sp. NBC_00119 TaxID=2975659 RepID=A0AAU1ULY7_9ACTN|nr:MULTISPECIES: transposase [unclassified Streptomyces]MCX4649317.1 transposase [Streptomyces sp. NBC_01446]MCX5321471.1 transposase [Streptomyces sp. NBC_00120]